MVNRSFPILPSRMPPISTPRAGGEKNASTTARTDIVQHPRSVFNQKRDIVGRSISAGCRMKLFIGGQRILY
jgi:hypothetical protein